MSITAIGPALDLEGPLPVARRYSLLSTPGIVGRDDGRWMNGVNVIGYPDGTPAAWEPCSTGTTRQKEASSGEQPQARFDPIAVYFGLICSAIGMSNAALERLAVKVEDVLDVTLSFGVERALVAGTPFSTNPFIGDTSMVSLAAGAVSPQVGQGLLENAIALGTGRQGIIHATPAVVSAWDLDAVEVGAEMDAVDDPPPPRTLRTANGTPVISGAGYIGVHPIGSGGLPGPGATSDWVFATGLVQVRIGDPEPTQVEDSVDHSDNDLEIRAEKFVLAEWDTALQVGVLIDWSL